MPDKMHESIVGKRSIKTRGFRSPWGRKTINGLGDCKFRYWVNAECFPLYVMTKGSKTVEFECLLFFCLRKYQCNATEKKRIKGTDNPVAAVYIRVGDSIG